MDAVAEDCLIVGGGPAGLTAALYLARFGRRFILADAGDSRAAWIPESHNFPVFSEGVSGKRMLALLREHVGRYGVAPLHGQVTALAHAECGFSAVFQDHAGATRTLQARTLLLATGALDCPPRMPALTEAMRRGLLRYCPICDGHEARGQRIAVIGQGEHGVNEALFMARTYGGHVSLLSLGEALLVSPEQRENAAAAGITLIDAPVASLDIEDGRIAAVLMREGERMRFDTAYAALGLHVRSELAIALGALHDANGALRVDAHNETNVPGLYAAGDTVSGLNQIVVAMGHAAVAATAIHNRCVAALAPPRR
jgi:thioredoxin reductase (NADPH)